MKYLGAFFFLLNMMTVAAQDNTEFLIKNSISTKAGYSPQGTSIASVFINYERRLSHNHVGIGTGFIYYQRGSKGIPLEFDYLFFNNKSHIEAGLSYTFLFRPGRTADLYSINLGYRYEDFSKRGICVKLGVSPGIVGEYYKRSYSSEKGYYTYPFFQTYFGIGYSF